MATKIFRPSKAPNLPIAPVSYTQQYLDQLSNAMRLYFAQVDNFASSVVNGGPFDYIDFITDAVYTNQEARIGWNNEDKTLNLGMDYGVVQQVGQETYARVKNETGVTIPNGSVVFYNGVVVDTALSVAPYLADGNTDPLYVLGIMTHDLPDSGQKGYCTTFGFIRGLNTSGFTVTDVIYASPTTPGAFTNIKPTAPEAVVPIGVVTTVSATDGVIFVRPVIDPQLYYGVFARDADYTPALADTAYPIVFDVTRDENGIVLGTPASRIVVPVSGRYQFHATLQFISSTAADKNIWVWFRKNGTDIPNSARIVTVSLNGAYTPLAVNEAVSLEANEYVEIVFAASSTDVTLDAVPATAFAPVAPAIVMEVTQTAQ